MVRSLVSAAVVCAAVALAGGCAGHKDRHARGKDGKIPTDRSVLTGVGSASAAHGAPRPTPGQAFAPAPAVTPVAAMPGPAAAPAPSAPQFHPVDPTDFAAPRPAYASAYGAGLPAPAPQQPLPPLAYPAQPAAARLIRPVPAPAAVPTTGARYQVQKGDTLFGIARSRYGDGKRWQEIAAANPGLTPASLRAGATIVVP